MRHPLLPAALGLLLGVLLWPDWQPDPARCLVGAALCAGLCALSRRPLTLAPTAFAAGLMLGSARPGLSPEGPLLEGHRSVEGVVIEASGRRATLRLHRVDRGGAQGVILLSFAEAAPPPGSRVAAFGRARAAREDALPGDPDPTRPLALGRARSELHVAEHLVLSAAAPPPDPFADAPHQGLLRALALGDRSGVSDAHRDLLRRTGTSHLLAISGLHLGLVAAMASGLAAALTRPLALLRPVGGLKPWVALLGGLATLAFGDLVGWPVSARRAGWMLLAAMAVGAAGRDARPWNLLALAAGGVALTQPAAVTGLSFGLSFGAVIGLLTVTPRITRLLPPDLPVPLAWLARALATTLGATAGTLPLAARVFQELSWTSPVANLLAVPLVSCLVLPAALVGAAGFSPATALAERGLDLLLAWLALFDQPTWHPAVGPGGAALLGLALLVARREALAGALVLLALALRPAPTLELRLHLPAVGQGDAALIEWPDGRRVLVDGGPPGDRLLKWLRRMGPRPLDEVVVTHAHPDHFAGLLPVVEGLEVRALRALEATGDEPLYAELLALARARGVPRREPWDPTPPGLEALHPLPEHRAQGLSENDLSTVLRLTHGDTSALLTGDIEARAEALLLDRLRPTDVLKVPHHGSRSSSTPAFLARLQPALALISCGVDNPFSHPRPEVLARLWPARVLRTDLHGTLELRSDGRRWRFRTWRPGRGWSPWTRAAARPSPPPPPSPPRG